MKKYAAVMISRKKVRPPAALREIPDAAVNCLSVGIFKEHQI